ncbi:DEKNAAC105568 [Brettanomyces naardenensis]|uniref:DEKNAAC105568 n=1 Tax=Brettanomyces naardenensis TaxID=13370 RepID=A0A448YTM5_BRENA|nr:DEKNAAC105568 [Brettanomyces naardenensis]
MPGATSPSVAATDRLSKLSISSVTPLLHTSPPDINGSLGSISPESSQNRSVLPRSVSLGYSTSGSSRNGGLYPCANDSSSTLTSALTTRSSVSTTTLPAGKRLSLINQNGLTEAENIHIITSNTTSKPQDIERPKRKYPDGELDCDDSPELLATSVGNEIDGQLIPSSSSISLLSLNSPGSSESMVHSGAYQVHAVPDQWRSNVQRSLNQHRYPSQVFSTSSTYLPGVVSSQSTNLGAPSSIGNRRSSFNSLAGTAYPSKPPTAKLRRSSSSANTQSNSIQINRGSRQQQQQQQQQPQQPQIPSPLQHRSEPDSPSLGPVSASGSPSCFYLTDHSPPSSLQSNASYLNLYMTQMQNSPRMVRANSRLMSLGRTGSMLGRYPEDQQISRTSSLCDSIGGKSPEFLPVSSTLPSMTPLNLSISTNIQDSPDDDTSKRMGTLSDADSSVSYDEQLRNDSNGNDNDNDDDDDVFGENIDNTGL